MLLAAAAPVGGWVYVGLRSSSETLLLWESLSVLPRGSRAAGQKEARGFRLETRG